MQETKIPFRVVRCAESALETMSPIDGHVVFTTDSRKIFMVVNGEFRMMGGSSGVFYGTKVLTDEEKFGDQVIFSFLHENIDGDELPASDDLILNIPDGGFYRVLEVNDIDIQAQRIAVSGSGGGGSGPSGPSNEGSLVVNYVAETPKKSSTITGVDYYIEFEIIAKDSAGDLISEDGTASWNIGGKTYTQKVKNGRNSFKVDEYLDPSLDGDGNKIVLILTMNTGGMTDSVVSKTWYVKAVDLKLKWDWSYNTSNYIDKDTFTLKFIPYGGTDCTAHFIFDGMMIPNETYFTKEIAARDTGKENYSDAIPSLPYGSHSCEMYLTAIVNGEEYKTPSVFNEVTFIKGGETTILTVPYSEKTANQYDTLNIPFMVYDPDEENCEVLFLVNDIEVSSDSYNRDLHYWPYTVTEFGSIKLTIKTKNNEAIKNIELVINKLDLDVSEVGGYEFSLKANTFSGNNEIKSWNSNGITLTFSDGINDEYQPFDWENGGLRTETLEDGSIRKYICVRQGTRMTINYPLFGSFNNSNAGGKDFKFCFKAVNCYDYEAPVLDCYDNVSKVGIQYNAQSATFSSLNKKVNTQYYESSYIELETEIWPNAEDINLGNNKYIYGDRYIMFWIDGIPVRAEAYKKGEDFVQGSQNRKNIVIGSDLCDVYVYTAKVYDRKLNEEEHLANFIMDAPTSNEMIARYRRNDILDNQGEISYEKLVKNNPTCHAYLYEIPHMTKHKDDEDNDPELMNCSYYELFDAYNTLSNPYYEAAKVQIFAQGTSSLAYGVAAFNLRSNFYEGLIDKDRQQVEGWKVSENAIPIDLACTKVNVASCENANNVVNQEWYNRYQPYHDAHRRKSGAAYRDTMEFNSGVMFIKDNNKNTKYTNDENIPDRSAYLLANVFADTEGYVSKPYFKQYAISNMGNDKKNRKIFHDVKNPRACCVEIADNQNKEHWMTVRNNDAFEEKIVGYNDKNEPITEGPFYEFRYSVEKCKAEDLQGITEDIQKQQFLDFVGWMASCDPNPYDEVKHPNGYTGLPLVDAEGNPTTVTFENKKFEGFDPPGYEGTPNPSGVSLKGYEESAYAGTYDKDTKEYRIAKMLNECEDHLVMDSVVYHYLFIQRHTMVDNVAKNTFWSTEDGIHWDLTKDYDNDTSDGNDNSGYLSYTYGYEFGDSDTTGSSVFNAENSVWINFIHALKGVQKDLHQKLEAKGAWRAQPYLDEFNKHQKAIPERCWIYDYFRKYIRPRRLGLDEDTYLKRLEGGQKTHQRNQFEKYQEFYMNSKYVAGSKFIDSAAINLRLNSKGDNWSTSFVLPVSFYIDCYASGKIGGQNYVSTRLKRKEEAEIPVGSLLSSASDSTCYIYGADMIQTFKGLSNVYPNEADFNNANKLRELELGSDTEGYYNSQLTKVNIDSATMLQKVQAQNVGSEDGLDKLDLSNIKQLTDLRIDGSTFSGLVLANGSIVDNLRLNDLKDLSVENMSKLTKENLYVDENIYNTLIKLNVINSPAFNELTYKASLTDVLQQYYLNNINWVITNPDELVYDEDNKVVKILVLEKLLNKDTIGNVQTSMALTGKITIDVECEVKEYSLYEEYAKKYPQVVFEYTDKVSKIDPTVELRFMAGPEESADLFYRVLGKKDSSKIGFLISADGPTGAAIKTPLKGDSSEWTYTFSGYWIDKNNPTNKYYIDGLEYPEEGAKNFNDVVATTNMIFYPEFIEEIKKYPVKFFDYDGNVILQYGEEALGVPYGMTYTEIGGPIVNFYYKDSSNLPDDKRYGFKGWSTSRFKVDEGKNIEFIDLETHVVKKAMNLYPYYETEDVHKVATSEEYFEIANGVINLKSEYKETLQGKITIPNTINNMKVHTIGSFGNGYGAQSKITHIYFLDNNTVTNLQDSAFAYCEELLIVDLPIAIRQISDSAFTGCIKLTTVSLNDNITTISSNAFSGCSNLILTSLPTSLITIGSGAFQGAGPGIKITSLPVGIEVIPAWTFNGCSNVKISDFGGGASKLKEIGSNSFNNAGNGNEKPDVEDINIHYSVEIIDDDAFIGYATNTLKNVYFARPWEDGESYGNLVNEMGFDTSNPDLNFAQLET